MIVIGKSAVILCDDGNTDSWNTRILSNRAREFDLLTTLCILLVVGPAVYIVS